MLESKDDKIKSSENKEPTVKSSKTKNKKNSKTKESVKKPLSKRKLTDPDKIDNVSDQKDVLVVEDQVDSSEAIEEESNSKDEIIDTQDTPEIDHKEDKLEDLAKEDLEKEKPALEEEIIAYDKLSLEELTDSL